MPLISQYRIFVYHVLEGVFRATHFDLWAESEKDALLELQKNVTQKLTLEQKGDKVALNGAGLQFIARSHYEKHRWPDVNSGRLPHSENPAYILDAERGRI